LFDYEDNNGPWNGGYWDHTDYGQDEIEAMMEAAEQKKWDEVKNYLIYYAENNMMDIENAENYEK
jgi:hypothetical protein